MRALFLLTGVALLLSGALTGSWMALNRWQPGSVGTPAHAGAVSNGRPQDCTNLNINVAPRAVTTRSALLEQGDYVRGTFEANGGFGRVDALMRIVSPLNDEMLLSPRAENYDFTFPVKLRGEYTFVFDNRYSLYTAKAIALYYCVERRVG